MLKTFNKAKNVKHEKSPKFPNFQCFNASFFMFLTDFVNWEVEKRQQRKARVCYPGFFEDIVAV